MVLLESVRFVAKSKLILSWKKVRWNLSSLNKRGGKFDLMEAMINRYELLQASVAKDRLTN